MRAQLKKIKFIIKYIYISVLFAFKKPKIRVLDDEETIQKVLRGYSLSRFGDGELRWAINAKDTPRFQNRNVILSEELKRILLDTPNNTLVCLPLNLINMKNKTYESKYFWKKFVVEYWKKIKPLIRYENIYGNTNVSRFYMDYQDRRYADKKINNLKKIWDKKNIIIVEGEKTKLGMNNDLLSNCNSIRRIVCPSQNAFDRIEEIYQEICNQVNNEDLVLLALGPTATVLSYRLSNIGIHSVDIGHVDIEYEWYLKKTNKKVGIPGKYVNEIGGVCEEKDDSDDYRHQISKVIQ